MTYIYHNPLTEVVIVRDGLKVGYASELGVGGVPVLFLAAELGQRPEKQNQINNGHLESMIHVFVRKFAKRMG